MRVDTYASVLLRAIYKDKLVRPGNGSETEAFFSSTSDVRHTRGVSLRA